MKLSPGKLAGLRKVSNDRGVIAAAAMDQRGSLQKSLAKEKGGEVGDSLRRQRFARRHPQLSVLVAEGPDQQTGLRLARRQGGPALTSPQQRFAGIDAQPAAGNAAPARQAKVRVMSGYRAEHWGLGEIEFFGAGAVMLTDRGMVAVRLPPEAVRVSE